MSKLCILHLVGSATDQFYCDLSRFYARSCLDAIADVSRYTFHIAYVTPDKQWRFPVSLDDSDIAAAKTRSLAEAVEYLSQQQIDIALPQMFCPSGMTNYRSLLDLLDIPYVGNTPGVMALTTDKAKAKAVVAAAGVAVPESELLRRGDTPSFTPPVVVKPTQADNSLGVTLVKHESDYGPALEAAFADSDEVLVERFIELGREVRCGIVVQQGELICLPLEEYRMDAESHPIRAYSSKLKEDEQGGLAFAGKDSTQTWLVGGDDPDVSRVWEAAKQSHLALGCRHYSLFDFRIDAQGKPWFLEAGLYCSFAPKSVISTMMNATGTEVSTFFEQMVNEVLSTRGG
ncbi:D-alanine--D-alanine ligase [Halomonas sp. PR-M31]|uniref:D-alanine--D-alanine ligase family protein n=1 Tax=Halomonas sp. PR-M31 TaxID=1471202 RepID=UPI0006502BD1|nr:D-alanine--D-alanine ligase [Halomonas sp. PR-M31]